MVDFTRHHPPDQTALGNHLIRATASWVRGWTTDEMKIRKTGHQSKHSNGNGLLIAYH